MALVKFYRGPLSKYNADRYPDAVFFATDNGTIHVNGTTYGGFNKELMDGVITSVDVQGQKLIIKGLQEGKEISTEIPLLQADDNSIVLDDIQGEGGSDGSTIKVNVQEIGDVDGLKLGDHGLYVDLTKTGAKIDKEISDRTDAINSLNATEQGGTGKFIQSVKEDSGIITAVAADLTATAVTYDKTGDKIIAKATNVSAAIKELDGKVAANKDAELTYKTVKLTNEEVTALGDANVKEAYKVVSVNKKGTETTVGEIIKIYKDSALKSIAYVKDNGKEKGTEGYKEGQFLKYVYTLADGSDATVYVDMSKLVDQAEVENGIQAIDGKLSIKVAEGNETNFLTVDANGLKLSGVRDAINTVKSEVIGGATTETLKGLEDEIKALDTKVQNAHTVVNDKATGHITVTVADSDDRTHKVVTVGENDIASNTALEAEVTRAKDEEQKLSGRINNIESTVAGKFEVRGGEHIEVVDNQNGGGNVRQITISAVDLATSTDLNALSNTVAGNTTSISTLNGDVNTNGSVAKTVNDAINSALTWVDVSIDTPQQ